MKKREIVFSNKLLWAALAGLLPGAYLLGSGWDWMQVLVMTLLGGLISVVIALTFLTVLANYMADRQLDGESIPVALLPFVGMLIGVVVLCFFYDDISRAKHAVESWIHCIGGCSR